MWAFLVAGALAHGSHAHTRSAERGVSGVVYRLQPSGTWHARWLGSGSSHAVGESWLQGTHRTVYVADVMPGQNYDLGLRLRAELNTRVRVAVYDRIPWSPEAKRHELPMGPVVRTALPEVEYRWHISISPRSEGRSMFVSVEAMPGSGGQWREMWHAIYLARAPQRPMDMPGRGVTYLGGPDDLVLAASSEHLKMMEVVSGPAAPGSAAAGQGWMPNLIPNGEFRRGLEGWTLMPEQDSTVSGRVAVDEDGLIISGGRGASPVGVRQVLQRRVIPGQPLFLRMAIRLDRDPMADSAGTVAPLELAVCYLDKKGREHCGARAYRRQFVTAAFRAAGEDLVWIPRSAWYEFEDDIGRLTPAPVVITSISITGGEVAGDVAHVRGIWLRQP